MNVTTRRRVVETRDSPKLQEKPTEITRRITFHWKDWKLLCVEKNGDERRRIVKQLTRGARRIKFAATKAAVENWLWEIRP